MEITRYVVSPRKTQTWWLDASPLKQKQKQTKQQQQQKNPSTPLAYFHHRLIDYQIVKGKVLLRPVSDRHSSVRNGNAIDREVLSWSLVLLNTRWFHKISSSFSQMILKLPHFWLFAFNDSNWAFDLTSKHWFSLLACLMDTNFMWETHFIVISVVCFPLWLLPVLHSFLRLLRSLIKMNFEVPASSRELSSVFSDNVKV